MMKPRSIRQSFLGENSDDRLAKTRVAIVGVSGGGSPIAQQLAHVGFGHTILIDPGIARDKHRHRLIGITPTAIKRGWHKVRVAERLMKRVHPEGIVETLPVPWQETHEVLRDRDLVLSCLDGYQARDELERYLRRYRVPMIDIGMDVHTNHAGYQVCGQVIFSAPGGPCMRCLGFLSDQALASEIGRYGEAGGRPQVVWPNGVLASTAVGMAVQFFLPWSQAMRPVPYLEYDGNTMEVKPSARLLYTPGTCTHYQ